MASANNNARTAWDTLRRTCGDVAVRRPDGSRPGVTCTVDFFV